MKLANMYDSKSYAARLVGSSPTLGTRVEFPSFLERGDFRDQQAIVQQKSDEVREQLRQWALENNILKPGQQIAFSLQIVTVPTVVSQTEQDILSLNVHRLFSRERCLSLGVKMHVLATIREWTHREKLKSVSDLIDYIQKQIKHPRNNQKKSS